MLPTDPPKKKSAVRTVLETALGMTPVVGDAMSLYDVAKSFRNRDALGVGLGLAGLIPGVPRLGDEAVGAAKALRLNLKDIRPASELSPEEVSHWLNAAKTNKEFLAVQRRLFPERSRGLPDEGWGGHAYGTPFSSEHGDLDDIQRSFGPAGLPKRRK